MAAVGVVYVDQPSSVEGDVLFSFSSSAEPAFLFFLDGLEESVGETEEGGGKEVQQKRKALLCSGS